MTYRSLRYWNEIAVPNHKPPSHAKCRLRAPHGDPLKTLAKAQEPALMSHSDGTPTRRSRHNNPRDLPMRLATGRTVLQVALTYAFPFPCSCAVRLADLPQQMCVCVCASTMSPHGHCSSPPRTKWVPGLSSFPRMKNVRAVLGGKAPRDNPIVSRGHNRSEQYEMHYAKTLPFATP